MVRHSNEDVGLCLKGPPLEEAAGTVSLGRALYARVKFRNEREYSGMGGWVGERASPRGQWEVSLVPFI